MGDGVADERVIEVLDLATRCSRTTVLGTAG